MSILVVGTVAYDTVETPFGRADRVLGGSATYASLAARVLGADVELNAVVGGDFAEAHVDALRDRGVGLDGLVRDEAGKTFFWEGRYGHDLSSRDTLTTDLNVLATFEPDLPASLRAPEIVCLGNLDPVIQGAVIDQTAAAAPLVVADTMNFWIESAPEALAETIARVDVLLVNEEEARQLADTPSLVKAARDIRAMGPRTVVIKKGEHGALLFCDDDVFAAPAYLLETVADPTGAGDTFLGGFAGHLARSGARSSEAMRQAVVVGSALASFVVESFGPDRLLETTSDDLDGRLEAFQRLASVPALVF
ncbi:PfkB family carbohydrate kinase [Rubrivirga sp. S365]|uniref:PfkB family carbohydrate kinase n=1 Tax=Rubrivirga litoralis TaxID=3075598 RepID=A0ABU3BUG3_9BACT|nr:MULTISPECIES: PfkB family carbohydrate kinase [unclassified Rubrivirga]MDT0632917.1 PfkB family carbohydrate kinase [Rubrivirga sp. F394]MDT7857465.1 PfkB family carbohydrate kinase [Rubrivirga sp. S365]